MLSPSKAKMAGHCHSAAAARRHLMSSVCSIDSFTSMAWHDKDFVDKCKILQEAALTGRAVLILLGRRQGKAQ